MMKTKVESTGIFKRVRQVPETQSDHEALAMNFIGGFDAKTRLDDIDKTLASIVEPYLLRTHPNASHLFGDVAADAEPIVIRARDARLLVKQVRDAVESNSAKLAAVFALDLGWALCQMGAEQFEPDVLKSQKATSDREKAKSVGKDNAATRKQRTIDAALTLWRENSRKSLNWVQGELASNPKVKTRFPKLPKSRTTIDKHTMGLNLAAPKSP